MRARFLVLATAVLLTACAQEQPTTTSLDSSAPPPESVAVSSESEAPQDAKPAEDLETLKKALADKEAELKKKEADLTAALKEFDAKFQEQSMAKAAEAEKEAAEKAEAMAAKERNEKSAEKLAKIESEFFEKRKEFRQAIRTVKSRAEYEEAMKNDPAIDYSKNLVALSAECSGTETAAEALNKAVSNGKGEGKTEAMKQLLEIAKMESGSDRGQEILELLTKFGAGEEQIEAMNGLLKIAEKDLNAPESQMLITQLVTTRGEFEPKEKALGLLLGLAKDDIGSKKSANKLAIVAKEGTESQKEDALGSLLEYHVDSDELLGLLKPMERAMPTETTENWLKKLCEKSHGKVKANAIITLSKFLNRRNTYREYVAGDAKSARESMGDDVVDYLLAEVDTKKESASIEKMLDTFVNDHESLLENAKKELFVLQNLSVGKTAPEIVGVDLDGKEFKLSDYRGKAVFLDFWGDW